MSERSEFFLRPEGADSESETAPADLPRSREVKLTRPWIVVALVALAACGGEPTDAPPEIQYGLEECGFCRMIVSEEKFAAAVVDEVGTASPFDDVGCLINHLREQPAIPKKIWVHDHGSGEWIAAEQAWFVRDPRGSTPMGSGLVAFSSRSEAETHAAAQGVDVVAWPKLLEWAAEEAPKAPPRRPR